MFKEKLSVVFPMYNEEKIIRESILSTVSSIENMVEDYEIIVVDDASTDSSKKIAEELSHKNNKIKLVCHKVNRGLGGALRSGFKSASNNLVLYSDSDMPFDMKEVAKSISILKDYNADIVAAFRKQRDREGIYKMICSYVYNFLVKIFFAIHVKDVNFSFKLFKKEILENIMLKSEWSIIATELLIKSYRKGYRIVQFGSDYFPRKAGHSKFSNPIAIIKTLYWFIDFRYNLYFDSEYKQNISRGNRIIIFNEKSTVQCR